MELLLQCAENYEKLLNIAYRFIIARKGVKREFTLTFQKSDFHHIAGLHKLADARQVLRNTRESIFDKILNGDITQKLIEKSDFYSQMSARLEHLFRLEEILDSEHLIFKYNENVRVYSRIKSDFLIEGRLESSIVYLFLGSRDESDMKNQMCRTFFPKTDIDYSFCQPHYTLLKKEKVRISDGKLLISYNKGSLSSE